MHDSKALYAMSRQSMYRKERTVAIHLSQLSAAVAFVVCQDTLRLAYCHYDAALATLKDCHAQMCTDYV
jgi:hypothetical protein